MEHFCTENYYKTKIFLYFYYNIHYVKTATVHLVWIKDVGPLYLPGQGRTTCPEVQPLVKHLLHTVDIRYLQWMPGLLYLPGQDFEYTEVQPLVRHLLHTVDIRYNVVAV
jgi:hypothetical protein